MNLSRYDMLLEQREALGCFPSAEAKAIEEMAEAMQALCHLMAGYEREQAAEELGHALLAIRGVIVKHGFEAEVLGSLEAKAQELHGIIKIHQVTSAHEKAAGSELGFTITLQEDL